MTTTYPSPSDPVSAFTRADGTTEAHSTDHGRVIGIWENVLHHGAKADGVTDDSVAIRAAHATGHKVYYPPGTYIYNSATPLTLTSGAAMLGGDAGGHSTTVKFTGSAGIQFTNTTSDFLFRNLVLRTTSPDLITFPTGGAADGNAYASGGIVENCTLRSDSTGAHLLYGSDSILVGWRFVNTTFYAKGGATVAPIYLDGSSNINSNFWDRCIWQAATGLSGCYFVDIRASTTSSLNYGNVFRDCYSEAGQDGIYYFLGADSFVVDGLTCYDPTAATTNDLIYIGKIASGLSSRLCVARNLEPVAFTFSAGTYMVNCTDSELTLVENTDAPVKVGTYTKIHNAAYTSNISGTPYTGTYARGPMIAHNGIQLFQKAGAPVDGDFDQPVNGIIALDTTNSKLYARIGGSWVSVTLA